MDAILEHKRTKRAAKRKIQSHPQINKEGLLKYNKERNLRLMFARISILLILGVIAFAIGGSRVLVPALSVLGGYLSIELISFLVDSVITRNRIAS